ncbi:MAG: hypothetical protein K0Q72_4595 [Armatimonadetes bacterium]|jgi:hypothetical protein|nr:hypothetical protein [Armatimonadota bacterium]
MTFATALRSDRARRPLKALEHLLAAYVLYWSLALALLVPRANWGLFFPHLLHGYPIAIGIFTILGVLCMASSRAASLVDAGLEARWTWVLLTLVSLMAMRGTMVWYRYHPNERLPPLYVSPVATIDRYFEAVSPSK